SIGTTNQSIGNIGDSGVVYNANASDVRLNDTYYQNDRDALNVAGIYVNSLFGSRSVFTRPGKKSYFSIRTASGTGYCDMFDIDSSGAVRENSKTCEVSAVVSLKPVIKVIGGEGTEASPYQIGI
ncbi:MAG: hypothetical protein RR144_04375, partial [Clostridia bacterium]